MRSFKDFDPYSDDQYNAMVEHTNIACKDPSLTLQAPADEQNINIIMARFGVKDGSRLPYWQDPHAIYGDFSEMPTDPVEAAEYIRQGELAFATLPAALRVKHGSGAALYNWLHNPENFDEAVKEGLLVLRETPSATPSATPLVSSSTSSDKEPLVQTQS